MNATLDELRNIASGIAGAPCAPLPIGGAGKLYELWLMFKLAERLAAEGYYVEMRDFRNRPTSSFIQRGSPGLIQPSRNRGPHPSFIYCRCQNGTEFEIHNSVQFASRCQVLHETDICIIGHQIGQALRAKATAHSAKGHPSLIIECKDTSGNIGVGVATNFLGFVFDATLWRLPALQVAGSSAADGGGMIPHTSLAGRCASGFIALATPMQFAQSALTIFGHYGLRAFADVYLGTLGADILLSEAVAWVRNTIGPP